MSSDKRKRSLGCFASGLRTFVMIFEKTIFHLFEFFFLTELLKDIDGFHVTCRYKFILRNESHDSGCFDFREIQVYLFT